MPLDLNTADIDELTRATGLSRERAQLLVDYRDEHGDFRTWDDVKSVPGFSQKIIELLKCEGVFFHRGYDEKAA